MACDEGDHVEDVVDEDAMLMSMKMEDGDTMEFFFLFVRTPA